VPIRKVTDPSVLAQLNGGGNVVAANPLFPGQMQQQQVQNAHTGLENQQLTATVPFAAPKAAADASNAQTQAAVSAQTAPAEITTKRGNAQKSSAEGQAAQANLAVSGGADNTQAKSAMFYNRALKSNQFYTGTGINDDPQGREIAKALLPDALVNAFTSSARQQAETAQRDFVSATLRQESGAAIAPSEFDNQRKIYFPQPGDSPETVAMKAKLRDVAIEGLRLSAGPAAPVVDQPGQQPSPQAAPQLPQMGLNGNAPTRAQVDPVLQATGQKVGAMLAQGVPDAKIVQFLNESGVSPDQTNIGQALKFRNTQDFKNWKAANPGKPYPLGPEFYTKQVPMTETRRLLNQSATDGVGGALQAGVVAAGDSMLGGRGPAVIGAINGDPQAAQTGMDLLRANHPVSSVAGDAAGQFMFDTGLGRIPGAQGLMATTAGRRGADALYGAYAGSGENPDNPLTGAVEGAVSNTLGGMIGRGGQKAVGRTLAGVKNAHLQYLDNRGVPLTLGQIARGSENTLGHAVGGIEERLAGMPVADAIIGTARKRGDVGFNREMFSQIAPGVSSTGAEGLAQARAAEQAAYSKLGPVRISVDPTFDQGVTAVEQAAGNLNHHAKDVQTVINDVRSQVNNGEITGKGYQTALQAIRKTRATLNDDVGGKAAEALDALENEVTGLGSRQSGQVGKDLADANAIHSRIKVVEDALKKAPSQNNDELISPRTLNQSSIRNTEKYGGPAKALSDQRPFYDLTDAGKAVMPNLTPDSGTAGRAFLMSTLFGGGLGGGAGFLSSDKGEGGEGALSGAAKGLTLAALLSTPYSKTGQKVIQKALLGDRPKNIVKLGDLLINKDYGAGLIGSALARRMGIQN
jgi:hypothetical protein